MRKIGFHADQARHTRRGPETQVLKKRSNSNRRKVAVPSEKNNKRNQPGDKWYRELLRTGFEFYERACPILQKTGLQARAGCVRLSRAPTSSKGMHQNDTFDFKLFFLTRKSCFPLCNYILNRSIWCKKNSYESFEVLKFQDKGLQSVLLNHLSSFLKCALGSNTILTFSVFMLVKIYSHAQLCTHAKKSPLS
jgi:hypothetical protein